MDKPGISEQEEPLPKTVERTQIAHSGGFAQIVIRGYRPFLDFALRHPAVLVVSSAGLLVAAIIIFLTLGSQFTPRLDEGSITAMVYKPVGMSLDRSLAIEQQTEREILRRFPQVTRTFSRIGTSAVATDPMPPNENDLFGIAISSVIVTHFDVSRASSPVHGNHPIPSTYCASLGDKLYSPDKRANFPGKRFVGRQGRVLSHMLTTAFQSLRNMFRNMFHACPSQREPSRRTNRLASRCSAGRE